MIEQILPDLYRVEIPLPKNPLQAINSYVIKGNGRFLVIDTGMNRDECQQVMFSDLEQLGVDLKKTDFFITHLHADHLGLAATLASENSRVYFNRVEASIPSNEARWQENCKFYHSNGFPEDEVQESLKNHPGHLFGLKKPIDFSIVKDGDKIEIGGYSFRCIETPGHSPGHTCLYDDNKKILISGDHILFDITPNINTWMEMRNSLKNYLASLEKTYALKVSLVLPGHRSLWNDHRKRIKELRAHHLDRLNEVLVALKDGEKTAYQTAPLVTWDVDYGTWDKFPVGQKWFAVGETVAHINYLEEKGLIKRRTSGDYILFSLVGPDHIAAL